MKSHVPAAVFLFFMFAASTLSADPQAPSLAPAEESGDEDLGDVLGAYVDEKGAVDYRALGANRAMLDRFLDRLSRLEENEYLVWPSERKLAFWINAYNAFVLRIITDNHPIKPSLLVSLIHPKNSIRQITGVFDKLRVRVLGRDMTLDEIEHKTLRRQFNEPRIHMALVCAARGCPALRNEPYVATRLDAQLEDQTRRFLASPEKFRIEREKSRVYLSFIFKWFGEDFARGVTPTQGFAGADRAEQAILSFVSRHVDAGSRTFLENGNYKVEYLNYDWSLNEQPQPRAKPPGM